MDEATQQVTFSPEDELRIAQDRLTAAKKKMADAEALRLGALRAKVAAITAENERKAAAQRAEQERIEAKAIERRNREREEEQRLAREQAAREAAIQAEISKEESLQQEKRAREKQLADLAAEAQALEVAAQIAQQAALDDITFIEEGAPETSQVDGTEDVKGERNPLARFLQRTDIYAQDTPVATAQEISSVDQSKMQARLDATSEGSNPVYAKTPEPEAAKPVVEPVRKIQRFVDSSVSYQLEKLLKDELRMSVGPMKLDSLSAEFNEAPLMSAARKVVAQAKDTPMSADGVLQSIESLLEQAQQ